MRLCKKHLSGFEITYFLVDHFFSSDLDFSKKQPSLLLATPIQAKLLKLFFINNSNFNYIYSKRILHDNLSKIPNSNIKIEKRLKI
jgi:hypothetical protein